MSEVLKFNTESWKEDLDKKAKEHIPLFPLVPETHGALKQKTVAFDFANPPVNANEFASSLVETCRQYNGLGLSANQCGFNYRVFVMGAGENYVAYFNPKILEVSKEEEHLDEGCLSFPALFIKVTRPSKIKVEYQDFNGETHVKEFHGMTARCFLHEYDHMEGITFDSRAKPMALALAKKKRIKLFSKIARSGMRIGTN